MTQLLRMADKRLYLSTSRDGVVALWDVASLKPLRTLKATLTPTLALTPTLTLTLPLPLPLPLARSASSTSSSQARSTSSSHRLGFGPRLGVGLGQT